MKTKEFIRKNQLYFLAFALPSAIMLLIFMVRSIFPFGDRSFLHIDMYHQYFPFLTEFYHKLKEGDSLLYSLHAGLGSNFVDLYGYYLASPTNWLVILVPEQYIMEFMSYMVIIKIGLSGFSFTYYLSKHFGQKRYSMLLFALGYSLSGYLGAYNWNVMWLDCLILAPFIILGLEHLVFEGKTKLYTITLAISILTNYYISIMLCIFLVLYFFVLLVSCKDKKNAIVRFALYSLLAGGMAAVILLPAFEMLRQSEYSQSDFPSKMKSYFPLFDVLARHLANVTVETGLDHWPNIYCGVAVFFLLPLYLLCKQIPAKEKIAKLTLLLFCIISFSNNVLTFIWHGMNYPNSLPSRQSFLYILLLLTVCYEAYLHWEEYSNSVLIRTCMGVACFVLLCEKLVTDDAFTLETYLLSGLALFAYVLLFYFFKKYDRHTRGMFLATLCIVMLEIGLNMYFTSVPTVSRTSYLANYQSYDTLSERLSFKDDGFYRIEKEKRTTQNDAMLNEFHSATLFSSTTNSYINLFYEKYGMRSSKVFYCADGLTPFMSALLSVNYHFSNTELEENSLRHLIDQEGETYLYENTYSLPFGFFVNDLAALDTATEEEIGNIEDIEEEKKGNPIQLQNSLAKKLGSEEDIFEPLPVNEENNKDIISVDRDCYVYAYASGKKVTSITASSDFDKKTFEKMKNPYIMNLGFYEEGAKISLTNENDEDIFINAFSLNEAALGSLIDSLKSTSLTMDSYNSAKLEGHITTPASGNLILSIPYEPNWEIKVDGENRDPELFENALISIPLSAGEHTIELTYHCKSLTAGILVSAGFLALFVLITIYKKRKQKNEASV